MGIRRSLKRISDSWTGVPFLVRGVRPCFRRPPPRTAGYVLVLTAGTGISVTGALLPAYLSWWWLDTAGHLAGGLTLALGLLVLFDRRRTAVGVAILSLAWEAFEWIVGAPFHVTVADTALDLLAGWFGAAIALLWTTLSPTRGSTL